MDATYILYIMCSIKVVLAVSLFYSYRFRKIARLVYVLALTYRNVVCEHLQRYGCKQWLETFHSVW